MTLPKSSGSIRRDKMGRPRERRKEGKGLSREGTSGRAEVGAKGNRAKGEGGPIGRTRGQRGGVSWDARKKGFLIVTGKPHREGAVAALGREREKRASSRKRLEPAMALVWPVTDAAVMKSLTLRVVGE